MSDEDEFFKDKLEARMWHRNEIKILTKKRDKLTGLIRKYTWMLEQLGDEEE